LSPFLHILFVITRSHHTIMLLSRLNRSLKILLLLLIPSLTSYAQFGIPDRNLPTVRLPITIENIEIIDKRMNISPGKIKIPIATYNETYAKHVPELTPKHQKEITAFFKYNLKGQGIPVTAIVYILDSYMEYGSLKFAQRERGYSKISVSFVRIDTGMEMAFCESSADSQFLSDKSPRATTEAAHRDSLGRALFRCTKSLEEESETWE